MLLHVNIMECKGLPTMGILNTINPYCEIRYEKKAYKTTVKKNNTHPQWNQFCSFPISKHEGKLIFVVKNMKPLIDKDASQIAINVASIPQDKIVDRWFDLKPLRFNKKGGKIHIRLHLIKKGEKPFVDPQQVSNEPEKKDNIFQEAPINVQNQYYYDPNSLNPYQDYDNPYNNP
ncbi:C2 domain (calcium/lipid-binding domain, CaLB) family [Trichomonas vaginalis G3]|nr:C2 domain (calcium/lipid-binding domain, CaLB) family [Trichomonas vaginalis G3]KAI5508125.1 C2 domain (calcium/lipid-binding domain, CaLB) family [Trichomonas vaginalis G3]